MCGRTCLSLNVDQICCACSYKAKGKSSFSKPEFLHEHNDGNHFTPSHNIAPTEVTPVLVSASKFRNYSNTNRVLKPMMWGVIPPWHKGDYRSHNLSTNNCRLENLTRSKLYLPLLKKGGRCIVMVEGFYEWQTTNKASKTKQPYYIYALQDDMMQIDEPSTWDNFNETDGWYGIKLLHMAAVYNIWTENDKVIYSYSIITMESTPILSWLHHRMPAILDTDEQINAWLNIDDVDVDMALSYLRPVKLLAYYPVATLVNNSRNKSKECNKRIIIEKKKSSQKSLTCWLTKCEKRESTNKDSTPKKAKNN